ncbi:MAG: FAD-dependent thymidylate synthase [Candidatus Aenigmatarchaeota archaeon]
MAQNEQTILDYFFTNPDKPIFALRNVPTPLQNYIYMGISRFPNVRERFLKVLGEHCDIGEVAKAINGSRIEAALAPAMEFAAERNNDMYFNIKHGSSAEGASAFVVAENCPIYATENLQDFYWPMTTMEFSTRYAKRFDINHVYWDPKLMVSEFAEEARAVIARNFDLYEKGFEPVMEIVRQRLQGAELKETVSALDAVRCCIPIAAQTTILLGGNRRAVGEHFGKLLSTDDSYVKEYAKESLSELSKASPGFFENIQPDAHLMVRNNRLREYSNQLFRGRFEPVEETTTLCYNYPLEETAMAQILYPYCFVPFRKVFDKVSGFNETERKELFGIATEGRENRKPAIRGFETRPLIYEIETGWRLWKDFKRNRMNLRFHQDIRGLAGWETPDLIAESSVAKEYQETMKSTSNLMEKINDRHPGLARTVAAQGSKKRFLLCMGPRQFTYIGELRTIGEGDRGYRKIGSRMIELAKNENPRLFGHVKDSYRAA